VSVSKNNKIAVRVVILHKKELIIYISTNESIIDLIYWRWLVLSLAKRLSVTGDSSYCDDIP
jgi:hypothetical protein